MRTDLILVLAALAAVSDAFPADADDGIRSKGYIRSLLMNNVGKTPALGWNSWNTGGCDAATADFAIQTANQFKSLGLQDLGYVYINIDDCWSTKNLDGSGNLVADSRKWPQGIKSVADQIHAKGLKFGLYGCAGTRTCADYPGSQGRERQHAAQLTSWGVDYWKYDNCYTPCNNGNPQTCYSPKGNTKQWYAPMRDALLAQSRPILFSLCQWGRDDVWTWGAEYGNSWRMSVDIWNDGWTSINRIGSTAGTIAKYAGHYGFNDLDMLQIGNGKLNDAESRTHFGLWAIAKSPLIIGTDLRRISSSALNIIKNKCVIDINQDSLGKAAGYFKPSGAGNWVNGQLYPYWAGPLSDGVVIGLIATGGQQTLSVNFKDVPGLGTGSYSWNECFSGKSGQGTSVSFNLAGHDMAVIKVTTSGNVTPSPTPSQTTKTPAPTPSQTTKTPAPTSGGGTAKQWEQCGGINFSGPTQCVAGTKCVKLNDYYSQCQ